MKNVLLFGLFIFLFNNTFAQVDKDKKAQEMLKAISTKMSAYKTIKADFASTLENLQDNVKESFKGTIQLKGKKYKITMNGTEIFNDGVTSWSYLKEVNEVNVSNAVGEEENPLDPTKIFTMWNKDFKVKFIKEKFEKARAIHVIDLYPTDLKKTYSRITLSVDKDKKEIVSIKYVGKDGNNYIIDILSLTPNTEMPDANFTFNKAKYPKVEVIDMR